MIWLSEGKHFWCAQKIKMIFVRNLCGNCAGAVRKLCGSAQISYVILKIIRV